MPFLLRRIKKSRWRAPEHSEWIPKGDIPGDSLRDMGTQNCVLSFWEIKDDRTNLDEVVVAVATSAERPDVFDYALVDRDMVEKLGIEIVNNDGESIHKKANSWHRDLVGLHGSKLLRLAQTIATAGELLRLPEPEVKALVRRAVDEDLIDKSRRPEVLAKFVR